MTDKNKCFIHASWFLWLLAEILIALLVAYCAEVKADEVKQEPITTAECNYVPKPSDQVYYTCSEQAVGTVEVKLWICGQRYTLDLKCPK